MFKPKLVVTVYLELIKRRSKFHENNMSHGRPLNVNHDKHLTKKDKSIKVW